MNETFNYTYSAAQQEEIRSIREKYTQSPKREDKMEQLRRLDQSVTRPGMIISLIVGIIGTLIMGVGMSCIMVWEMMILGVIVGVIGVAVLLTAYPIYNSITKKQREKLTPEIMRLSEELIR